MVAVFLAANQPIRAGIIGSVAGWTGADITVTLGGGPLAATGADIPVPPYPGFLEFGVGAGSFPYGYYGAVAYFVPPPDGDSRFGTIIPLAPPSMTPTYVSETGGTAGAVLKLVGHVHAVYELDESGLPATTVSLAYPYLWIAGPSSTVTFSADITFSDTDGVFGPPDDLLFSTSKSGSVGMSTAMDSVMLAPLPAGDASFTVDGTFTLTSLTGPGDSPSLIKVFGVPEPGAAVLLLCGVGVLVIGSMRVRRACRAGK